MTSAAVPQSGLHPALRVLSSPRAGDRAEPGLPSWRIVVCPHAGGSASYYRRLVSGQQGAPEVVAVQYPGRETRFGEPPATTIGDLLDDVAGPVRALLRDPVPTVLLGHSLGASLALRIAAGLSEGDGPDVLALSGRSAWADPLGGEVQAGARPGVGQLRVPAAGKRDDRSLKDWIESLGGTPPELLDDDDFFAMHAGVVRADLAVHDSLAVHAGQERAITVPLVLLAGARDRAASPEMVAPWAVHARSGVSTQVLDGGHFFFDDHSPQVVDLLRAALVRATTLRADQGLGTAS